MHSGSPIRGETLGPNLLQTNAVADAKLCGSMIQELALAFATRPAQAESPAPEAPRVSIETEVLTNVKNQALGKTTVDALALPDEYLKRIGDRIIRSTFEQRYRVVVQDPPPQSALPPPNTSKPVDSTTFQPPSAVGFPLVIGTILLVAFVIYLLITARARKETPL